MERILLSHDKRGFEKALSLINKDLGLFNIFLESIISNSNVIEITKSNVQALAEDAKGFLFSLMWDSKPLTLNGLPISKEKAIDLVEFPDKFKLIIKASSNFKQAFNSPKHEIDSYNHVGRLSFDDIDLANSKFYWKETFLSGLKEHFSTYTRNENQNEAFRLISQLNESIEGLVKIGFVQKQYLEDIKLRDIGFKFYDGKISVDYDQIGRVR